VFYKDLVERYRVGNPLVMRRLLGTAWRPASLFNAQALPGPQVPGHRGLKRHALRIRRPPGRAVVVFMLPSPNDLVRKQAMNEETPCHRSSAGALCRRAGGRCRAQPTGRLPLAAQRDDLGTWRRTGVDLVVNRARPKRSSTWYDRLTTDGT
jgi:hypothetical protein